MKGKSRKINFTLPVSINSFFNSARVSFAKEVNAKDYDKDKEEKLINNSANVWEYYFNQQFSLEYVYEKSYFLSSKSFPIGKFSEIVNDRYYYSYLFSLK